MMSGVSTIEDGLLYMHGIGNHFETEAEEKTLPLHRNNPLQCPRGLYCEQLSGTSFTSPRSINRRVWLYRSLPSAAASSNQYMAYDECPSFGGVKW